MVILDAKQKKRQEDSEEVGRRKKSEKIPKIPFREATSISFSWSVGNINKSEH